WAMKKIRQAAVKPATSNVPSSLRNFIRLMLARLHAVSSRNMYSEHGFEALIRPELGQVCQWLIVVSYCTPGSPQPQAHSAMRARTSRAGQVGPALEGSVTQCVVHSLSSTTACMKSSVRRTERLAFWNRIELYASPLKLAS